ncbi:MAG: hypothetical protein ACYTAS_13740 [Planctomycetota bacterium]|jgi:hypothetical protein
MKKSIILFVAEVTFLALGITEHAGKPVDDKVYAVYACITEKPDKYGEPTATVVPDLYYVEDEAGNDLILLGLVDRSGTATFSSDEITLNRAGTEV